jgi:hypothetical protein
MFTDVRKKLFYLNLIELNLRELDEIAHHSILPQYEPFLYCAVPYSTVSDRILKHKIKRTKRRKNSFRVLILLWSGV